jgi:hypothetical protein
MSTQFWPTVAASITSVSIVAMLRQVVKARKAISKLADEHRFLLRSMSLVLSHLNLSQETGKLEDDWRRHGGSD